MNTATKQSSEFGTNCWLPVRFCSGRCGRVMPCTYPEKRACKAVQSEIDYLTEFHQAEIVKQNEQLKKALQILRGDK